MPAANFTYGATHVRVDAPDAALRWLSFFLEPWFAASVLGPSRTVELVLDADGFHALAARAGRATETVDCFLLDSRVVRLPIVERANGWTWTVDSKERVALGFADNGDARIIAAADKPAPRVALMRIVREIAVVDALAAGRPLLHASAAATNDGAVAMCGRKRAGKTTLLLHRLLDRSERFVANDRCLGFEADDGWQLRGLPTIVALRADTIARFPALATVLREAPQRHWLSPDEIVAGDRPWADEARPVDLAPAQLCALLGVEAMAEAPLQALLFPKVDPAAEGLAERALSVDEARSRIIDAQVGADYLADYRPVLAPSIALSSARAGEAARDEALTRLSAVPAFEVRLGPRAYDLARSA